VAANGGDGRHRQRLECAETPIELRHEQAEGTGVEAVQQRRVAFSISAARDM
jgi:hypothetical protein